MTTAKFGRVESRDNAPFLWLSGGQRLEHLVGQSTVKITEFEEYGTRTSNAPGLGDRPLESKLLSTRDLIEAPSLSNLGELAWRIGLALSAVNFVVLAIALATVNPRAGRSGNTLFILLIFIVYNNLLNLGQSWIFGGAVTFTNLLLFLHGGVLLLASAWLAKRHYNWRVRPRRKVIALQAMPSRPVSASA